MKLVRSVLAVVSAAALLSACGGDGGDSTTPPAGGSKVAITSSNQTAVVRASVNAGLAVSIAQGSTGGGAATAAASRASAMSALVRRGLGVALARRQGIASASAHVAAVSSDVSACAFSGTLTTTLDDKDANNALSSGDVITATFARCRDSSDLSIDGTLVVTLTATPNGSQFTANGVFKQVAVVDGNVSSTISGNVAIAENDTSAQTSDLLTVGAAGLDVAVASPNYNDTIAFRSGLTILTTVQANGSAAVSLNGVLNAQSIGGDVTISTPQAVVQNVGDAYPSTGQFVIVGAAGSSVRATVLDATQVKLELDADGNGSFESTTDVAWSTLIP